MTDRERRLVLVGGIAAAGMLVYYLATAPEESAPVVNAVVTDVAAVERRLARVRQAAASIGGREGALKRVQAELTAREQGILQAETAAQAQAQLLQVLRRVSSEQPQAVQIRGFEPGQVRPLGEDYGEVLVSVSLDCRPEQLVNLLADLTRQKELVATTDIRLGMAQPKEKVMPVRLTVSAVVPRRLVPKQQKGVNTF